MGTPDWINDNKLRTWNNAWVIGLNTLSAVILPVGLIWIFIQTPQYIHALWVGMVMLWLIYELCIHTYVCVSYLDGKLIFERPLCSYGLLSRRSKRILTIHPDEWTEVYRYTFKGGGSFYFRNGRTAAYFISLNGFSSLYNNLGQLFPGRGKSSLDFPMGTKKRMKKEFPERVF